MGMLYFPVYEDVKTMLQEYDDAETGRLFKAMMAYAFDEELPQFNAPEKYVWPVLRAYIDKCKAKSEQNRTNRTGATANKSKRNATGQNETERTVTNCNESEGTARNGKETEGTVSNPKHNNNNNNKDKDKDKDKDKSSTLVRARDGETDFASHEPTCMPASVSIFRGLGDEISADDVRKSREEMDAVEAEARRVGVPVTCDGDFRKMEALIAEHGADNVLRALGVLEGCEISKRNWKYVAGILRSEKGRGYTFSAKAPASAYNGGKDTMQRHQYTERDFSSMVVDLDAD